NRLEQTLSALTERSAFSVLSQSGFASEPLRRYLQELLRKPAGIGESFLADPVFEAAFGWRTADESIEDLSGELLDPDLVRALNDAVEYRFPRESHPYAHQLAAWRALEEEPPRSVIVTSGTGSG